VKKRNLEISIYLHIFALIILKTKKINQMSASKVEKARKDKVQAFKQQAKEKAKQAGTPKTHLLPLTEWNTTDVLDLGGDLAEALEQQFVLTWQTLSECEHNLNVAKNEFQKAAHILQMVMQRNIKAGKVKLKYSWNNGEDATEAEVKEFQAKLEELQAKQREAFEKAKAEEQAQANAKKTGLVGLDGAPIGTDQDLDGDTKETAMENEAAGFEGQEG